MKNHRSLRILRAISQVAFDENCGTGLTSGHSRVWCVVGQSLRGDEKGADTGMSTSTIAKASKVDRAVERLEAAVDRLDLALTVNTSRVSDASASAADDSEHKAALDSLRQENSGLRDLNRTAADRLAGAITRLESLTTADLKG